MTEVLFDRLWAHCRVARGCEAGMEVEAAQRVGLTRDSVLQIVLSRVDREKKGVFRHSSTVS